jgi:hypothetical protein
MKSIGRQVATGVLTLGVVLMETVSAGGDPAPAQNEDCLGETFHVTIERHSHGQTLLSPAGGYSPYGDLIKWDTDFEVKGTYVRELRDGKQRWISRSIDWQGKHVGYMPLCNLSSCNAGGHLELKESELDAIIPEQQHKLKWNCTEKQFGNCFRVIATGPPPLPYPVPRIEQLRYAVGVDEGSYSEVKPDGTRYSETVEPKGGNEKVTISAEDPEIDPNQLGTLDQKGNWVPTNPDKPGTQLTIRATCDGKPLKDRQIGVRVDVFSRSGGHIHDDANHPRPRGKLAYKLASENIEADCGSGSMNDLAPRLDLEKPCITVKTDVNGEAPKVTFKPPLTGSIDHTQKDGSGPYKSGIAGTYWITARDVQIAAAPVSTMILAKIKGCDSPGADPRNCLKLAEFNKVLTGVGATSEHPENFYGTPGTLKAFTELAEKFRAAQDKHNEALKSATPSFDEWKPVKLSLNDIALRDGGIFDLGKNWGPSHYTHSKGQGGDFNRFTEFASKTGIDSDGSTVNLQIWYLQTLIELGKSKDHKWDCTDLGGSTSFFSGYNCNNGQIPPIGGAVEQFQIQLGFHSCCLVGNFGYIPPLLHLHVEDD